MKILKESNNSDFIIDRSSIANTVALEKYIGNDETVVVPDGVTLIGGKAFAFNKSVKKVVLPPSTDQLCDHAFTGCRNLVEINLDHVEFIGNYCFYDTGFQSLYIPHNVQKVGDDAFNGCDCLEFVNIDMHMTDTFEPMHYNGVFTNCRNLKCLDLSDTTLTNSLHEFDFWRQVFHMIGSGCTSLRWIVVPESISPESMEEVEEEFDISNIDVSHSLYSTDFFDIDDENPLLQSRQFTDEIDNIFAFCYGKPIGAGVWDLETKTVSRVFGWVQLAAVEYHSELLLSFLTQEEIDAGTNVWFYIRGKHQIEVDCGDANDANVRAQLESQEQQIANDIDKALDWNDED